MLQYRRITQDVSCGNYPDEFTSLLCSEKDWSISIYILVFVKQNVKLEFQELLPIDYRFDIVLITWLLCKN